MNSQRKFQADFIIYHLQANITINFCQSEKNFMPLCKRRPVRRYTADVLFLFPVRFHLPAFTENPLLFDGKYGKLV